MKVLAINGSPHANGNTACALEAAAEALHAEGIETEILHIGHKLIHGCTACEQCHTLGKCVFDNDPVNEAAEKMAQADGILLASPVYYAGIAGTMKSFLDRVFYTRGSSFRHKVGASIAVVRRSGGTATLQGLNWYLSIGEMILPTGQYWAVVHGRKPGEARLDLEGMQTMRTLGKNMAWTLKLVEAGKETLPGPKPEEKEIMSFIR
ncbi:flavodoxin family protein [Yeguia hominis]|uniref:Flavodoxin family protein n=1 Tax=Yeguia hominis TaxID=2763662 RepID=A0A926HRD8_9FIRM|nr:flavodoxin family protein [Yeguia hominis]MBC8532685.1 flavodoxin family protein [Yeguia hominis]